MANPTQLAPTFTTALIFDLSLLIWAIFYVSIEKQTPLYIGSVSTEFKQKLTVCQSFSGSLNAKTLTKKTFYNWHIEAFRFAYVKLADLR